MLLTCEKDLTDTLNIEAVTRRWSMLKKRRVVLLYTKHFVWLNVIKKVANVSFLVYVTINFYTFNSFTFDIKYYQLSVLYMQETTMNSHKIDINKSFTLWKKMSAY